MRNLQEKRVPPPLLSLQRLTALQMPFPDPRNLPIDAQQLLDQQILNQSFIFSFYHLKPREKQNIFIE